MRAAPRFRLAATLLLPLVGSLLGCAPQRSWDDYASKTDTMKFLTFLPCNTFFVPTRPEHQMYFHVSSISANADGSYRVEYQQQSQRVFERMYFLSVLYVGLRDYTGIGTAWMPSDTGARCAALVVLPWSSASQRPFAYQKQSLPRAAATQSLFMAALIDVVVFIGWVLLLACAVAGYSNAEYDEKAVCIIFWTTIVVLNASVWVFNSLALTNIADLASYYEFYDALPKDGGHLLPLPWSQAHRLFDGPPHPTSLIVDDGLFWIVLCLSCAAWLAVYVRRIAIGITYATMADPFEELRLRLAAEGQVPTPEDYMDVMMQTGATMSEWQLELLKRQMKVRLPDA
jgi:hypothetical protein